jgi:hypothetical protein
VRFNPATNTTSTAQALQTVRVNHGATVVNNTIIVCGGFDGSNYLTSCEQSNADVTVWTYITALSVAVAYYAMVTLNGSAYVIGGYSATTNTVATVYMWNGVNAWVTKSSLPEPRDSHNAVVLNGDTALVCGGEVGGLTSSTCRVYTASTNTWTTASTMAQPRRYFGLVMSDGMCTHTHTHTHTHTCICRQSVRARLVGR